MEGQMASISHTPKKVSSRSKAPATKAAAIKTKAPVTAKASALADKTSKVKTSATRAKAASAPKTPPAGKEAKAQSSYQFLNPLPDGFGAKLLTTKANETTGERATKLRVMASLYSGHDYSQAAQENHVPLGNVYLWLADFRKGGLAAL
jgi:hypothetical protein